MSGNTIKSGGNYTPDTAPSQNFITEEEVRSQLGDEDISEEEVAKIMKEAEDNLAEQIRKMRLGELDDAPKATDTDPVLTSEDPVLNAPDPTPEPTPAPEPISDPTPEPTPAPEAVIASSENSGERAAKKATGFYPHAPEKFDGEEKSFTERELERLSGIVGRTTDDRALRKLNLALRYEEYKKQLKNCSGMKEKGIMIQRATLEDLATAKRELEEAMFMYDPSFEAMDAKTGRINNEKKEKDAKDRDNVLLHGTISETKENGAMPQTERFMNDRTLSRDLYELKDSNARAAVAGHTGRAWIRERLARNAAFKKKIEDVAENRDEVADRLTDRLEEILESVKADGNEIYETYEWHKDDDPVESIKKRRHGIKDYYKDAHKDENPNLNLDDSLDPHPRTPDSPDGNNNGPNGPDSPGSPDNPNGPDNPDSPDNPDNPDGNNNGPEGPNAEEEKAKLEEEEKAKLEEEEKAKLEEEEKAKLEEEEKAQRETLAGPEDELIPLVAINADFTHDRKELARDLAEQALNEEVAKGRGFKGFINRLWKGTLFKKVYQEAYEQELLDGTRKVNLNGEEVNMDKLIVNRSNSAIMRFVLSATEGMGYVHERAGEKRTEANAETTAAIKSAIERFASAQIPEGGSLKDLERDFTNEMMQLEAEAKDNGKNPDRLMIRNYLDVAIQARKRVEHGIALERVMEGFKVYNADVRDNIRTQAHRDNVDKIVNKLESSKIGRFIPAEVLAGAVTVASGLAGFTGRMVGGLLASSAISGLKERNRVTEDRARMLRDLANGGTYGSDYTEDELNNMKRGVRKRVERIRKYEAKIGGSQYNIAKASDLTKEIKDAEEAIKNETANGGTQSKASHDRLIQAIATARARVSFSDSEAKDLISYSSENERGKERLALDVALIRAEKALSDEDRAALRAQEGVVARSIVENVDKTDNKFANTRALLAMKKAGKTLVIGALMALGTQEIGAALSEDKIGILEKYGVLKTNNTNDASETFLASHFGQLRGNYAEQTAEATSYTSEPIRVTGDDEAAIAQFEQNGYTKTEVSSAWTETRKTMAEISPAETAGKVQIDGFANNGTKGADFNELRLHMRDGQMVSTLRGSSTMGSESFNYEELMNAGKIKGIINIGGTEIEVMPSLNSAGQMTWGEGGLFTTPSGETIRGISDTGEELFKYFRVAADNGVDADGVSHVISLATEVGQNSADATISTVVTEAIEHPAVYEFVKTIDVPAQFVTRTRDIATGALAFAPETSRVGLGSVRQPESAPNQAAPRQPDQPAVNQPAPRIVTANGDNGNSAPAPAEPAPAGEGEPAPAEPAPNEPAPNEPAPAEPAPAVENNPTATGENNPTPAEQFFGNLQNDVENLRDLIGAEGVSIILDPAGYNPNGSSDARYAAWWDNLSEEAKNSVRNIYARIANSEFSNQMPWGRGFRVWYQTINS